MFITDFNGLYKIMMNESGDSLGNGQMDQRDNGAGSTSSAPQIIDVEIYADIICPWCYIGKKRLDAAFAARPHITPRYIWRTFLLNPSMPPEGMSRSAYLNAKFGHSAASVYGRIAEAGLDSGIQFKFDAIEKTPDSRKAHRLMLGAGDHAASLSERLYQAYFLNGQDIGDVRVLADIMAEEGIEPADDPEAIERQLESDLAMAGQLNLDGVPFFIFGGKYAVAGAHLPEHLVPAIDAAAAGN